MDSVNLHKGSELPNLNPNMSISVGSGQYCCSVCQGLASRCVRCWVHRIQMPSNMQSEGRSRYSASAAAKFLPCVSYLAQILFLSLDPRPHHHHHMITQRRWSASLSCPDNTYRLWGMKGLWILSGSLNGPQTWIANGMLQITSSEHTGLWSPCQKSHQLWEYCRVEANKLTLFVYDS